MANMLQKLFKNQELGIEITSLIDQKQNVFFFLEKMLRKYLGIRIV